MLNNFYVPSKSKEIKVNKYIKVNLCDIYTDYEWIIFCLFPRLTLLDTNNLLFTVIEKPTIIYFSNHARFISFFRYLSNLILI